MSKNNPPVHFSLNQIVENQFSTFEIENLEDQEILEQVSVGFGADERQYAVLCSITYVLEAGEKPFIKIEVGCVFTIQHEDWEHLKQPDGKVVLPVKFAQHLGVITTGTTRGVLYANTRNTVFADYPMSLMNIEKFVTQDIVLSNKEN